jgi:hypothetical protein
LLTKCGQISFEDRNVILADAPIINKATAKIRLFPLDFQSPCDG